jgi:deoxyadenosine/deoxycytidine kinase
MKRIVIDGNIGSGKSTQLGLLENMGYKVHMEPIKDWPLDLFYENNSRWAFLLQMQILASFRVTSHIYERCPSSSNYVFWRNLYDQGVLTQAEDKVYQKYYQNLAWTPDVYIYLYQNALTCHTNIQSRNQTGDKKITLKYLEDIEYYYEQHWDRLMCPKKIRINVSSKTPSEINTEILSHLRVVDNELLKPDAHRKKVPKDCSHGWKMLCTYLANLCHMS